jgi:hypothetical protein
MPNFVAKARATSSAAARARRLDVRRGDELRAAQAAADGARGFAFSFGFCDVKWSVGEMNGCVVGTNENNKAKPERGMGETS